MTYVSPWGHTRGLRIRLEVPAERLYEGEPLTGVVRAESMSTKPIRLREISVYVGTFGRSESASAHVLREILTDRRTLPPLGSCDYAFSVTLPHASSLGRGEVNGSAFVGPFRFALALLPVMVFPQRRVAAFFELVAEIAHQQFAEWSAEGDRLVAELRPKMQVETVFYGIRLALRSEPDGVSGVMTVTGRASGLMRAFPGASRSHAFRFGYGELDRARREFEAILLPYIGELKAVPIPTHSVICPGSLPLPARPEER